MTILDEISKTWFFSEPLLFSILCTHSLKECTTMKVPFRTGNREIEYNPEILAKYSYKEVENHFKIELFRILLKHPYQRQPEDAKKECLGIASDIAISDSCLINTGLTPKKIGFEEGLCFEEYYEKLIQLLEIESNEAGKSETESEDNKEQEKRGEGNRDSKSTLKTDSEKYKDMTEKWQEDEEECYSVNEIIKEAIESNQWGTISGNAQETLKASLTTILDYRRIFRVFSTSVLSSKRQLTRMKPSRRFGFKQMGSKYNLYSNLLVAVDVSGSISEESIQGFYSTINRFFKYGIESIDVIQFDTLLKSEHPQTLKKAATQINIIGRGGTNFQVIASYYDAHTEYDGLILFTDGFAPYPTFNRNGKVLWVLNSYKNYQTFKANPIKKTHFVTYIPS